MATLNEIIFNIKNIVSRGRQSDDFLLSDRQVAFQVNYYRAKLLKQDLERGGNSGGNSATNIQNLGKVSLIKSDINNCCNTETCILRTELKIPDVLDSKTGEFITFVGTIDHLQPFQKTSSQYEIWNKFSQFTSKNPRWYILDNYIYIVNPPTTALKYINIQGIFNDPTEAIKFRTCDCPGNELNCSDGFDEPYPLDTDKIDIITKLILQTEFNVLIQSQEDSKNDTRQISPQLSLLQPQKN